MDKKEEFKMFVKEHPKLITYVKEGKKTWQNFYEMYDLYGDSKEAWKDYLEPAVAAGVTGIATKDILDFMRNINLDEFQNGINNVQRVLGMLGDLTNKDNNTKKDYKPRPIYKHFED